MKLYETGFSPLPLGSTKERMVMRNRLPDAPRLDGIRLMEERDVESVTALMGSYLWKFDLAPVYSEEHVKHWFLHKGDDETRVVWTYVVEVHPTKTSRGLTTGFVQENYRLCLILFSSFNSHKTLSAPLRTSSISFPLRHKNPLYP